MVLGLGKAERRDTYESLIHIYKHTGTDWNFPVTWRQHLLSNKQRLSGHHRKLNSLSGPNSLTCSQESLTLQRKSAC